MSYSYATERPWLFTEEGQTALIKARDNALAMLEEAGAFKGLAPLRDVNVPSTWQMLAILDRMVEMGDIREVTTNVWGQRRVFVAARES